ncbi:hypothetical protein B0J15DRAFT_570094 [Fusarium solani]|uniref:NADPH--cytochrome P450 reductase n=1 Tax=Fusarium solani TaxID=169388 RepID=A0A9P9GED8_FUSSL|nr:uncharacterized protein B0J15DRAFT_570094 [Fusarium solani]KAH7237263.1 hypothetical protein B0J15DRAFT_570094 [Fusarium solani]
MATFNSNTTQVLTDAIESLSNNLSHDDYILLPLVILGTAFVINKGSILPKKDPLYHMWFQRPQAAHGSGVETTKRSRNVADLIKEAKADLVIFWGSQSGTAEGFAHRLAREAHQRYKLTAVVADLSDYDAESVSLIPSTTLAIFIMSTYGEGDPSDNAQDFVTWTHSAFSISLNHLKFAAFGCGNSNYRYFNKTIDEVVTAMVKFGAIPLVPTGKGNEATRTTEEDFMDWKETLFSTLATERDLTEVEAAYEPEVEVIEGETIPHEELHLGNPFHKTASKVGATNSDIVPVSVVAHTELARYAEQDRSCIEVKVDLTPHLQVKYKTGDHIAVWPENSSEEVDTLIRILGLETRRSNPIRINAKSGYDDPKVPNSTTIEALFRHYLEISSPVPRETVLSLARVAPSSVAKKELQAISKDRETYAAFLNANYLTFSRLLAYASSFDSSISWTNLPLSFVIDSLQPMQPRLYSISSSRITSPRQVTLTVSVKPSTLLGKPDVLIPGITSSFLSKTAPSDDVAATQSTLQIQIRPSTFKLPINALTPLVMVAAGTGIAPFRAFVQERARLASVGHDVGKMVLFFGCQNESDYLYSQEFQEATSGPLAGKLELVPAFSRAGRKKTYVQDKVHQRQEEVLGLLQDQDAAFYICGAATMAKNVGDVLSEAIKQKNDWPDARAESWRAEKKKGNRWFEDVWS